jgi:pyruvate,water dikinase
MDILWLGEPGCDAPAHVGGKAATLSAVAALHAVPPGFCLTTSACARWCTTAVGMSRTIPPDLAREVEMAYRLLALRCGVPDPAVAVRSSGVHEDGAAASFAGQHETYLNVAGAAAVAEAVMRCWASAWAPRALAYRHRQGLPTAGIKLAVLVQYLVAADVSAVAFSAHPLTGSRDDVVVTASWGLGESIVGGTVTPDTYLVRKAGLVVISRQIAAKARMTVPVAGGVREVEVPRFLRSRPALADEQVREIAQLAASLEETMGWPVDLECAYKGRDIFLLQCRPITATPILSRQQSVKGGCWL